MYEPFVIQIYSRTDTFLDNKQHRLFYPFYGLYGQKSSA